MIKQIFFKTYNSSNQIKGIFYASPDTNGISFSSFQNSLNGGLGDLGVIVPRKFDEFNSDDAIDLGYEMKVFVSDDENPNGIQIYSGVIDSINTQASEDESVTINCSGYVSQLATDILEYGSHTVYKKYTSTEIGAIIKDMIDYYKTNRTDDRVTYNSGSTTIDNTGKNITLEIYNSSPLDAIQHAADELEYDWYWKIGVDNNVYVQRKPLSATHLFMLGKDIVDISIERNIRDTKTGILVANGLASGDGDAIFKLYSNAAAITSYGRRFEQKRDGRYKATAGNADEFADRFLNVYKDPMNVVTLRIVDSYAGGYDIESIKPGDSCKILNITPNDALTDNMLITNVTYAIDYVDLTLSDTIRYVNRELLERKRENDLVAYTDDQKQAYTT